MELKEEYEIVHEDFAQVYGTRNGYIVSARSKKWGLNTRKTFSTKKDAREFRKTLIGKMRATGAQPDMSRELLLMAKAYDTLCVRLGTGKGHTVGFILETDGGSKIAQNKNGHTVSKYWGQSNLTTDLRNGKLVGRGDQTMRTLCDE